LDANRPDKLGYVHVREMQGQRQNATVFAPREDLDRVLIKAHIML
jgi:hypothetical protein